MKKPLLLALGLSLLSILAEAKVKLAAPFTNKMVLQREMPVCVWGKGDAGEKLVVEFKRQKKETLVDKDGNWKVFLDAMASCKKGEQLVVTSGKEKLVVRDVLVGEVWMCSGQSNAELTLWGRAPRARDGLGSLVVQMTRKPWVRLVKTPRGYAKNPKLDFPVNWTEMTPETIHHGHISAMGYYFALELTNALDIPIGIVDSTWGGSNIDAWTPPSGVASREDLKDVAEWKYVEKNDWRKDTGRYPIRDVANQPYALWNGMVAAYAPMTVRGVIWYQGCSNAKEYSRYCSKMHALYNGWAKEFENPNLKFYFVQLTPWGDGIIPHIQEAQAKFASEQKNSEMAIINDIGNLKDIHPNNKLVVGKRLAAFALANDYGFKNLRPRSPTLKSWEIKDGAFHLTFNDAKYFYIYNADNSLSTGFEIAGADGVFKPAKLKNVQEKTAQRGNIGGSGLIVYSDDVKEPKKLRYLYSRPWFGSIYNDMSLPMGVFHID